MNRGLRRLSVGAALALFVLVLAALWCVDFERAARRSSASEPEPASRPAAEPVPAERESATEDGAHQPPSSPAARETVAGTRANDLARAVWIEGRVVFPPGTPADEEAFVEARGKRFADGSHARERVAPDGSFRLAYAAGSRGGRIGLVARYVFLEDEVPWKAGDSAPLVLEPQLGGRVEGRLVVPGGAAPEEASGDEVTLYPFSPDDSPYREAPSVTLQEGLDFAFGAVRPGVARLEFEGESFWCAPLETLVEPGRTRVVALEVRRGVALRGRALEADGQPVAGARVSGRTLGSSLERSTTSESDGSFALLGLPDGTVLLRARADGFADAVRELADLVDGETRDGIELVFESSASVEGRVSFPDGVTAVARVSLLAAESVGRSPSFTTKVDGRFRIHGVGPGPFRVHACDNSSTWRAVAENVPAGTTGLELVLEKGLTLAGWVKDDSGEPVKGATVVATPSGAVDSGVESVFGRVEADDGGFRLQGLRPGALLLYVSSKACEPIEPVTIVLPRDDAILVRLPREASVAGTVRDPRGAPMPGAKVFVRYEKVALVVAQTDERGAFVLEGLVHGTVHLCAVAEAFAPSEPVTVTLAAAERQQGRELVLRDGARVAGEVVDREGQPIPWARLSLDQEPPGDALSDGGGKFELASVIPGEVRVIAHTTKGWTLEARTSVRAGDTAHVRLEPPTTSVLVHGRVLRGGRPAPGVSVLCDGPWSESGADGAYEVLLPAPGKYTIALWDPERKERTEHEFEIPAGEDFALDLPLE